MVEILNANDNLPVFEDRADLTVPLNEVEFCHELVCMNVFVCMMGLTLLFLSFSLANQKPPGSAQGFFLLKASFPYCGCLFWVSVETTLIATDAL